MKRMILSAFFFNPQGDHRVSWRHPKAPSREVYDLPYFQSLAAAAEEAKPNRCLANRDRSIQRLRSSLSLAIQTCALNSEGHVVSPTISHPLPLVSRSSNWTLASRAFAAVNRRSITFAS